jgi:hypothetical protein
MDRLRKFLRPCLPMTTALFLLLAVSLAPAVTPAQATDEPDPGEVADVVGSVDVDENDNAVDEESAFSNPAQAQKAENLAIADAIKTDTALDGLIDDLEAAKAVGDPLAIEAAEKAVADRLAEIAGMDHSDAVKNITDLRELGYGWGQIAQELGVHPSALGLGHKYGHTKTHRNNVRSRKGIGYQEDGLAAATARDVKTGWAAAGHGIGARGKGKSAADADSFDSSAAKDKSTGKSNSGKGNDNNGKGNDNNGKGNDKK